MDVHSVFIGGDNFISICPNNIIRSDLEDIIKIYEEKHKPWKLKVGVGQGINILEAISEANKYLRRMRDERNHIKILGI